MLIQEPFRLEEYTCLFVNTNTAQIGSFIDTHSNHNVILILYSIYFALQKNRMPISWKHIEALFLMETTTSTPGVRLAHKLTHDHIWLNSYSKMKVYLAAHAGNTTYTWIVNIDYIIMHCCIHAGTRWECCQCSWVHGPRWNYWNQEVY